MKAKQTNIARYIDYLSSNMLRSILGVVLCASLAAGATTRNHYCDISPRHTMCRYQGIGKACGQLKSRGVTSEDMAVILDVHNKLRAKVANGQEHRGQIYQQPPAANMRQLEWDEELAQVAQQHADQCVFDHDCNECRKVDRFSVGQNLASMRATEELKRDWSGMVTAWYDEVKMFNPKHIQPFKFEHNIGHYTQMLWADTTLVGCGYTRYFSGGWWKELYTCNYGPAGNVLDQQMYAPGEACSRCPAGASCSKHYRGLCAGGATSSAEAPGLPTVGSGGQNIQDVINQLYGGGSPAGHGGQGGRPSSGSSIQDLINQVYGGSPAGYGGQGGMPSGGTSIQDLINQVYGGGSPAGYGGQVGMSSRGTSIQDMINQMYGGGSPAGYGGQVGMPSRGTSIQDMINQVYGGGSPAGYGGQGASNYGNMINGLLRGMGRYPSRKKR